MQKKSNSATFSTYKPTEKNNVNETSIAFFWAFMSLVALLIFVFSA
jgi:hypothetical protein